ncbi:MAG TPA: HAD family phosphatase [Nitrolancea sp.]|nr:HAD family phosphatase [Nitrolancea sp.]
MILAVVFDLDGILVETEEYWDRARREFVAVYGETWTDQDQLAVMGHNSRQWAQHIEERFSVPLSITEIESGVIDRMLSLYRKRMPVLPGAISTVRDLAPLALLGVASSSPLRLIHFVLDELGIRDYFKATVSSDEVEAGKPEPDVYLLACERLDVSPDLAVAFEDSSNGILSAHTAGLGVIAIPNRNYPPSPDSLQVADLVLPSLEAFRPEILRRWEPFLQDP